MGRFLALNVEGRREIARLHSNLGHPDANVFVKFLTERKAEPQMIHAVRDYTVAVHVWKLFQSPS